MKKMVYLNLVILILLFFNNVLVFSQPPTGPIEVDSNALNTSHNSIPSVVRDLPTSFPLCSCDCSEMVKSARIYSNQTDDDVYLRGGKKLPPPKNTRCQKIELNLSACNGLPINCIDIEFDNNPCLNYEDYEIYYEQNNGNLSKSGENFNPYTTPGQLCLNDEPIPACSSRKVVFYICNTMVYNCPAAPIKVHFNLGPPCENREMYFVFDQLPNVPKIDSKTNEMYYDLKLNHIETIQNFEYRILDVYSNFIESGNVGSIDEAKNKIQTMPNNSLLILQVFKNNQLIYETKTRNEK